MATTIYSFKDVNFVISHPSLGRYVANGAGIGSITVTMTTDRTQQSVAADGSVMVSKVEGRNASIGLSLQQTSDLTQWLINAYNYLDQASASEWAQITISLETTVMKVKVTATGVAFQVLAEQQFQQQGQELSWTLLAANVTQQAL